jgi:hypothetical protein
MGSVDETNRFSFFDELQSPVHFRQVLLQQSQSVLQYSYVLVCLLLDKEPEWRLTVTQCII